jgi:hypothetical protein
MRSCAGEASSIATRSGTELAAVRRFRSGLRDLGRKHDDHLADAFASDDVRRHVGALALLGVSEGKHAACAREWKRLLDEDAVLVTSSYVLVETCALAQRRHGVEAVAR